MTTPLSPAAQAVLTAQAKQRCLFEWSNVNDPPCHPSDPDWNGCVQCIDRLGVAATLRAVANQVVPEEPENEDLDGDNHDDKAEWLQWSQRTHTRRQLLAIADELEGQP